MTLRQIGFRFASVVALLFYHFAISHFFTAKRRLNVSSQKAVLAGVLVLCCFLLQGCPNVGPTRESDEKTVRTSAQAQSQGIEWLIRNQSEDGGWRSTTYGTMRSGVGTTAIALEALSRCSAGNPEEKHPALQESLKRGMQYLTTKADSFGMVCAPDAGSDSPVYATALVISAGIRTGLLNEEKKQQLVQALLKAQQIPANNWPEDAVGRGGWGVEPDPATAESNPATISVTAFALNALAMAGALTPESRVEALHFLNNCRSSNGLPDGGFWFVPRIEDHLNKAGWFMNEAGSLQPRSYHTATCDGIISLNRLGFGPDDPESQPAIAALLKQSPPSVPVKLETTNDEAAPFAGLYFYGAMALSSVGGVTNDIHLHQRMATIQKQLTELQRPDGSWESPLSLMREDDPLIATSLALIALCR